MEEVTADNWFDFGHYDTFYQSKARLTTERSFNRISVNAHSLTKTSERSFKIFAESEWYLNLPESLKLYTPKYYGRYEVNGAIFYTIEYLFAPTLAELFVFSRQNIDFWKMVISRCFSFLKTCKSVKGHKTMDNLNELYYNDKTILS